ncbi:histidine kinase dimerization/phospho-acceptor domain-containing protein [Gemmatimonas sp.]|jgi:PAS domain S-box-containing protein|uniref:histidine kinase dimerization/phospho-acceptor domain-containing protein n=1 Tax=Gemmatimonas sp. TaxID=1962908 RepID=UPI0037C0EF2A
MPDRTPSPGHGERNADALPESPAAESTARESEERRAALRRSAPGTDAARMVPTAVETAHADTLERAFPALAEGVRDYTIFLMDPEGIITYWGEGARYIKWWMRHEAEGAHLRLLYPDGGADDGTAERHLLHAARDGEYVGEGHRVRRDGSMFMASVTLTALREPDGTLIGFTKVTRDLTARRAADVALEHTSAEARSAAMADAVNVARSQFVSTVSHEVRTPIQAIMAYAELLERDAEGSLTDKQRRFVSRMKLSANHLLTLVNDVLEVTRTEAHHEPTIVESVLVGHVVTSALGLVEPQAHQRGISLRDNTGTTAGRLACWGRRLGCARSSSTCSPTPYGSRNRMAMSPPPSS